MTLIVDQMSKLADEKFGQKRRSKVYHMVISCMISFLFPIRYFARCSIFDRIFGFAAATCLISETQSQ